MFQCVNDHFSPRSVEIYVSSCRSQRVSSQLRRWSHRSLPHTERCQQRDRMPIPPPPPPPPGPPPPPTFNQVSDRMNTDITLQRLHHIAAETGRLYSLLKLNSSARQLNPCMSWGWRRVSLGLYQHWCWCCSKAFQCSHWTKQHRHNSAPVWHLRFTL